MDAIESLITDFRNKKINAGELQDQLAGLLEPNINSTSDLEQQETSLKNDYQLPPQAWDGVKTIIAESLSAKTRIVTPTDQMQKNNAKTIVADVPFSDTTNDNKTVLHTSALQTPASPQINLQNAETVIAHEVTHETTDKPITRREHTNNYLDPQHQSHQSTVLEPGSILKNRFILEKELGHGGMSVVYRALDLRKQEANNRNPYIAIKLLGNAFKNHPQSIRVLEHETQKIQSLAHPNIITVYDFDRDGDSIYMTMECLEGESLDVLIRNNDSGLAPQKALPIIQAMARALFYAHSKNIIHSDLKPENIFITKDGTVKVLDFGIARAKKIPQKKNEKRDNAYVDFDGSNLGALTPSYASPEMFEDADPDQRDDIYALGCVTYKLLTGRHPFNEKQSNHARDDGMVLKKIESLSRKQWHTLSSSLAFDRDMRITSIADFLDGIIPKKRGFWFYASITGTCIALIISAYAWYSASQKPVLPQMNLSIEQKQKIANYLETADIYLTMGYLASPPGDSAFDQYEKILAINPTSQSAIKGKKKIAAEYEKLALQKINANKPEESLLFIKTGLIVEPENKDLLELKRRITKMQAQQ